MENNNVKFIDLIKMEGLNEQTLFKLAKGETIATIKSEFIKTSLKGLKGVDIPAEGRDKVNTYLSNYCYTLAYKKVIDKAFDAGTISEDEKKASTGLVSYQLKAFNKPFDNLCKNLYKAYLKGNNSFINKALNKFLGTTEYDYYKGLNLVTTGLNGTKKGFKVISVSNFTNIILSLIIAIMAKSGNKVLEGAKFEATFDKVKSSLISVNRADCLKKETIDDIASRLYIDGDYIAKIAKVYRLYKSKKILILDGKKVVNDEINFD